jgi:hypothetical protein
MLHPLMKLSNSQHFIYQCNATTSTDVKVAEALEDGGSFLLGFKR